MKICAAIAGLTLLLATNANSQPPSVPSAGKETEFPPVHVRSHEMEMRIHKGINFPIVYGTNNLDNPHTLTCRSPNGCVILMQSEAMIYADNWFIQIYSTVDGTEAFPAYTGSFSPAPSVAMQSIRVKQGTHAVQTIVNNLTNESITISSWQVSYTLYEGKIN